MSPFTSTPFAPTHQQVADLLAWFAEYDALARKNDVEAMADQALFPLTVISHDSAGERVTQQWDRATFVQAMGAATDGPQPELENHREPHFLSADLAVVVTTTVVKGGDDVQYMRYADVMAKTGGRWRFTSMVQAGWGDMMRDYFGA
jgi:ketosteroid isomerase-like protein